MSGSPRVPDLSGAKLTLDSAAGRISAVGYGVGVIGLVAAGLLASRSPQAWDRVLHSWLVNWVFFLSLTLGALFFILLQHVTRAGWSVVVRRLAEGFSGNFFLLAILGVPVVMGLPQLYEWARPEAVAHDHLLQIKEPYLNRNFFIIRLGVYFLVWIALSRSLFSLSVKQDATGDASLSDRMLRISAPGMYLFALTLTFAGFDLLMSLEPRWYSTIFGVYFFAGGVLGFFALLPMTAHLLQRTGRMGIVTTEHFHDMGKLMFAFVVFWSYIAFSQYMLIWYANIPEETVWFLRRITGQWTAFSWFILLGHFLFPFLALISRIPKRRPGALALASVWVLLVHWGDIYWLVMPQSSPGVVPFHWADLATFLAIGGLWTAAFATRLKGHALVPQKDPRLAESLAFENF